MTSTIEWEKEIKARIANIAGILNGSAVNDTGQAVIAEQKLGDILEMLPKLIAQVRQDQAKGIGEAVEGLKEDDRPEITEWMISKDWTKGYNKALSDVKQLLTKSKE